MSDSGAPPSFVVPWSYRAYRALILLVFVAILLVVGVGAGGSGPVHALHGPAATSVAWVKQTMGINDPVTVEPAPTPTTEPAPPPATKNANNKKKKNKKKARR